MGLLYRIRLEGLLINAKMLLLLAALWYFCEGFVACNSADGIVSFISVSIAFDTTIAVKWVQRQFSELFTQNIRSFAENCKARREDRGSMRQGSFTSLMEHSERLTRRFEDVMAIPSVAYPIAGVVLTLVMLAMLYVGIPDGARKYVIVAPFPAMAYYGTAILAYIDIFVQLNGSYCDRKNETDLPPGGSQGEATDPNVYDVAQNAATVKKNTSLNQS